MRREQLIPQEIQYLIDLINNQKLILAEIELDEVTAMPDYRQVLRVCDTNIPLSANFFKATPKRILIHKIDGSELDLNLQVPNWERKESDIMALTDDIGNRLLFETNYYDTIFNEETQEDEEVLVETKQEVCSVPTLKCLIFMSKQYPLISLFEKFTHQYVSDMKLEDEDYFKRLK